MSPTTKNLSSYEAVAITDEISHPDNKSSWVKAHIIDAKGEQYGTEVSSNEIQESATKYNDVSFAIAFLLHLAVAIIYGVSFYFTHDLPEAEQDLKYSFSAPGIVLMLVVPTSLVAFAVAYHAIAVIAIRVPVSIIYSALSAQTFLNTFFFLFWFLSSPGLWTLVFFVVGTAISIWYYFAVQVFIPFAAANLKLAAMGLRSNMKVFLVALGMGFVGFIYFLGWFLVGSSVAEEAKTNYVKSQDNYYYYYGDGKTGAVFVALLFSMYWTITVTANVTQTTVAGVMGTWCFDKFNPAAVSGAFYRSCVTSFGSICFGSLLNAIIMTLRYLASNARENARENGQDCAALLACIAQCILSCIQDLIEYFNQWAYVFVGVYGSTYLESGKMVFELFKARGFTSIISTDLVSYFLFCIVSISGLLSGLTGIFFCKTSEVIFGSEFLFGDQDYSLWVPFGISYVVGIVVAASVTNVVQAGVKTIIVCFADDPFKVHENHPEETKALSESLSRVFPGVASPIFSDVLNRSDQRSANNARV